MRVLVQRSSPASVIVSDKVVGKIDFGLVLFVGFTDGDDLNKIDYMINKILNLRIFPDENNVMNKSILDVGGSILSISQFTLYGDCSKGNRPSYVKALSTDQARVLYDEFNNRLSAYIKIETGIFGADMNVSINNIGPTTIWLER